MANYHRGYYKMINEYHKRTFRAFIDEGEVKQIEKWVLMKDDIETGGDLFGLWVDQHTAVVQFVLGPGEDCRRTSVSFFQDVNYLQKAGTYLTKHHGLCNIGQWHSHHRLSLRHPSGGDENTVWRNMPQLGLNRYIVFIATIEGDRKRPKANLDCFLFETDNESGQRYPVLEGDFKILKGQDSPLRRNSLVLKEVKNGEERVCATVELWPVCEVNIIPKNEKQVIIRTTVIWVYKNL